MAEFEASGEMTIANDCWLQARMIIDSYAVSDEETLAEIASLYRDTGYLIDPHTATGVLRRKALPAQPGRANGHPRGNFTGQLAALLNELGINVPGQHGQATAHLHAQRYRITPDDAGLLYQLLDTL